MSKGKRIVILGAGFGGLACANLLRANLSSEHQIAVFDKKDYFLMGFVNLWILNGKRTFEDSKTPLINLKSKGISFIQDEIISINPAEKVFSTLRQKHEYDYLVIALGTEYAPEKIDGFVENGGFNLYDVEHIQQLRKEILALKQGRIAICITSYPYKCPPAPYEASLLISDILVKNGTRNDVGIDVYCPASISLPVAGPKVSQDVIDLLDQNHVSFHPSHKLKTVTDRNSLEFECEGYGKESVNYSLLIGIPPHVSPMVARRSGFIKDGQNWINADRFTMRTEYENVFAIGDITEIKVNQKVSIPKAGIFAEGQAKVVSQQIVGQIRDEVCNSKFDGKGFCFMETGESKAGYIDTNFYNKEGPITSLYPPSEDSYRKKIDFEKNRVKDWLLPLS